LLLELTDAPLDDRELELEIRDPVGEQPADAIVPLENHDLVTGTVELLSGREPRGARPDHGDALARAHPRRLRANPTRLEALVSDRFFDQLDGHGVVVDVEDARGFARRRAHATGDLREVVRLLQRAQ